MSRFLWVMIAACWVSGIANADEQVPTDFKAAYLPLDALAKKLAENGLAVIGKHAVAGNKKVTSVIYTCDALKKSGSAPERGFIAALRILHNADQQELVVSNPEYYIRAYMQKDYQDGMAQPVMQALKAALGELTPTADSLGAKELTKYNFMMSMPKYHDFARVAKGSAPELLAKLEASAADRMVFKLDIKGDGSSILCGVALPQGIEKFNEKLETMGQSHLLPYTVLIENGEANILHAKYYLALSFPRLSMGEFMKIRSVPGNIEDAFKADFK